ncbi:hypothetical protein [Ensifer soli]|uniref:hypothetical protein n=1 Tax=Ciceribacter sp. sgz301302 TaxID=3342379 RepID=UPI0035BADAE2
MTSGGAATGKGLRPRLRASLPPARLLLAGAPLWGMAMALSASASITLRIGATGRLPEVMQLYFIGGTLAWPFALVAARFLAAARPRTARFCAFLLALVAATLAMTAFLFAMDYRLFYAQWHQPFGTRIWAYQFVFTSAAAVYQFVVIGVRLYLPIGAAVLVATSLWLSARDPVETARPVAPD